MSDYSGVIRFDGAHPALPGHFPGQPLVPGVLMLEQVALALRAWRGERLSRVVEAKFMAPLLPDESAQLQLSHVGADTARIGFRIERDGTLLARGIVEGTA
jgi:3-hydroxymyristoyl/3-hydroxydecanoyl-(acyl carrier protein) dehydratase